MSEKYKGISDEELIDMLRQGENGITDFIMDKYKNLVRKKAKSMYILGADSDDLIQEGMIGLLRRCGIMTRDVMRIFTRLPICAFQDRCTMRFRRQGAKNMRRSTRIYRCMQAWRSRRAANGERNW